MFWSILLFILVISYGLWHLFLVPVFYLIKMKLKYGKNVKCYFIPLVGFLSFVKLSEWVYKNPFEFVRKLVEKEPEIRFLAAGGFYYKEFVVLDRNVINEI
jgi:hypothetical protein